MDDAGWSPRRCDLLEASLELDENASLNSKLVKWHRRAIEQGQRR
jgi:hypothetical protein